MLFTTAFCCFLLFWSGLWLGDFYLRSGHCPAYVDFAEKSGLLVAPFQIRFYTSSFQHSSLLQSLTAKSPSRSPRFQRLASFWFGVGALICVICFVGITAYLTHLLLSDLGAVSGSIWKEPMLEPLSASSRVRRSVMPAPVPPPSRHLRVSAHHRASQTGLTPIIPGVNIPWSHMPVFVAVLVVAGVVHELGHAMAAVGANVAVNGFGVFLFAVYPGAFTEIDTEGLNRSSTMQKLRIYGAGIWHNLVFALLGYLLLVSTPTVLFPLFTSGNGVTVTGVNARSGLTGPSGLRRGHIVEAINGYPVRTETDWKRCVEASAENLHGYSVPDDVVLRFTSSKITSEGGEMQCCSEFVNASASPHICFQYVNHNATAEVNSMPEIRVPPAVSPAPLLAESLGLKANRREKRAIVNPENGLFAKIAAHALATTPVPPPATVALSFACLNARLVTKDYGSCDFSVYDKESHATCVTPALYNGTVMLKFALRHTQKFVLFVGLWEEALDDVSISPLTPRVRFAAWWLVDAVELLAKYVITFSLGLALLNAVPCYGLDGQYIAATIVDVLFVASPPRRKRKITNLTVTYGSVVLGANIFAGFVKFFIGSFA
ncbi:hypothetical protein QR680_013194 [Steinernema hermaphroditum]|uniref:Membrane-bound transcription factor site-2 protease n=1 Tax=Steinernema hermaphroditum TaxID=289476 RepID=A0AA39I692_9BILA|nr:hypothetical protein QR680_013194 [Steinernema hermaphroditum]